MLLDATVAPSDIRYPTDIKLLNEAREQTEIVIDALYEQVKEQLEKKPRTYRREARTAYLQIAKQRQPNRKKIRKALRQQLGYVRRNLAHIDTLIAAGAKLSELKKSLYRNLLVVSEVYRQQQWMYEQGGHRIDDRIVSITQPHVRPIVRGKAGTPVEFGAKLPVSCVDGHAFPEQPNWGKIKRKGGGVLVSPGEMWRLALVWRLAFALYGLRARLEDVWAGPEDASGGEEGLVDRLLAAPRYGGRWAGHWFDVCHFADAHGF